MSIKYFRIPQGEHFEEITPEEDLPLNDALSK